MRAPAADSRVFPYTFKYPKGTADPLALVNAIASRPDVEWAAPDKKSTGRRLISLPTDPYFPLQFTLDNPLVYQGRHVDINPEWAWFETRGAGIKIAVVDGGVQVSHPDFSFSQPIRVCDAFGDTVAAVRPHGGAGAAHGTAVAGIIFARHSNGQGIAGVAPEAQIIVTRIANDFGSFALDQYIADAIRCAWFTWGADILNNSWTGGPPDPNISGAIVAGSLLGRGGKGSLFVAAAGNDLETVGYPANIPQMLAVNAITRSGALPSYAAPTGMTTTDLVAPSKGEPGEQYGVITTDVATSGDGYDPTSGYFMYFGGTSAAAPQVSGAAALVLPRFSTLNRFDLNARLASTAESWGPSATFGAGKVDASSAADVSELHAYVTGEEYIFSKGSYTWTASPSGGIQSYSYRWRKRSVGGHGLSSAGVQSVNQVVYGGDSDFDLELRVISGGQTTYSTVRVVNCIGVPNCVPI